MMQSSPPTRAWERPQSPAESQYSLDFGALGSVHSNESSPVAKQRIDRVLSEDIEGPSDFTINMDKWMRGGTLGKGTARSARSALQTLKEQEVNARSSVPSPRLQVPDSPTKTEGEQTASHHTPSNSPPKESVWDIEHQGSIDEPRDEGEHQDSSDWDPYDGTPQPPVHKEFLQPTVEDYYSELTPARVPSAQRQQSLTPTGLPPARAEESPEQLQSPTEAHVSPSKMSRSSTPGRPSSPTLSPVRSPVIQRSASAHMSSRMNHVRKDEEMYRQLQQLQARCQQLGHLNSALKQALDEEQRIRRQEKTAHEMHMTHATRRENDLTEMKEEAYKRAADFKEEYAEQKVRLRETEVRIANQQQELERSNQYHKEEVEMLRDEMQTQRTAHDREVEAVKQKVEQEKRKRNDAEEAAKMSHEGPEEHREAQDSELQRLRLQLQQVEDAHSNIKELENQLKISHLQVASVRAAKSAADNETAAVRAELDDLKMSQDQETMRVTGEHERAVELAEGLQKKLEELQQQLHDEQTSHDAEIERMQDSHDQAQTSTTSELNDLRNELEANQSLLNDAILERDAAQDSLASLQESHQASELDLQAQLEAVQAQLEASKAELKDSETVNAALDARISEAVRKREGYWKGKLEAGEKERGIMAKALLHQWGREEVGVEVPQGFEYRYSSRRSPGKGAAT